MIWFLSWLLLIGIKYLMWMRQKNCKQLHRILWRKRRRCCLLMRKQLENVVLLFGAYKSRIVSCIGSWIFILKKNYTESMENRMNNKIYVKYDAFCVTHSCTIIIIQIYVNVSRLFAVFFASSFFLSFFLWLSSSSFYSINI